MNGLAHWVLGRPRTVVAAWLALLLAAGGLSLNLAGVIRGSTDGIPGSPSQQAMDALSRGFGPGSSFVFPVVLESAHIAARDARFAESVARLERALTDSGHVRSVRHFWNSGAPELLGKDGRSALLLVAPRAGSFYQAETMVGRIRADLRAAGIGPAIDANVTGPVAVFHDMNRHSADDLLAAERVAIPLTLLILVLVFGAPLAAVLPLLLALAAVLASLAALVMLGSWMPVSIFARNAVSMIGLGVGVDYALLVLGRYRAELGHGRSSHAALVLAVTHAGRAVALSGMTVAAGFIALLLVRIPAMASLAIGGTVVVLVALAATLTLLPALLRLAGESVFWPFKPSARRERDARIEGAWGRWARFVMQRPWTALVPALLVVAIFVAPVFHLKAWNPGARDLPATFEARQGADALRANFGTGWLGPVVLAVARGNGGNLWAPASQDAVLAIAGRLSKDARVARIGGFPALLDALGEWRGQAGSLDELPPRVRAIAGDAVTRSADLALIVLVPREAPENPLTLALVEDLRRDAWPEAQAAGLTLRIAGASAGILDFDRELFGALWRVIPAVLLVTYLMLLAQFRSVLIPLKATLLNLLSVLAAWGLLVLVFQRGVGAGAFGLEPTGGLNGFIVLMLFSILFGLSMDYEVFLLSRIKEERDLGADNATAVARGLQRTAGTITSAALIMACIFGSFAFTNLVATRQFGVGLAFAVALDATLIRVVLVPALMQLLGERNWWMPRLPGGLARTRLSGGGHGER
jgi:putative drug exporter of the RND superfamily